MRRPWLTGVLGLVLAACGFGVLYAKRTAAYRELEHRCGPELAWIKQEFQLNDDDFERVRVLHEAYKPVCAGHCRQVDEKHRELAKLLAVSTNVTPEIQRVLGEADDLRKQCHVEMLKHFFEVSRAMPPEQSRRYLDWMQAQTLAPAHQSMLPRIGAQPAHDGDAH